MSAAPDDRGLRAGLDAVALFDASELTRLVGDGPDLLGLLHRLSTADVKGLAPGSGRATVLTTAKGRIVDRLHVHPRRAPEVLLLAGAGRARAVLDHLARYTFAERTGLRDASAELAQWSLAGPRAEEALAAARLPDEAQVVAHDGAGAPGVSVVVPAAAADETGAALLRAAERLGGRRIDAGTVDLLRILHGVPVAGAELTEDWNPLEAGLAADVSFTKGCYVGQEVVARLQNYDKVSRRLLGVEIAGADADGAGADAAIAPGAALEADGREAGVLTRLRPVPGTGRRVGLAYVRIRRAGPGDRVRVAGGPEALLRTLPFPDVRRADG